MGLFSWLFGKGGQAKPAPRGPERRSPSRFKPGDRVLARWVDAFFYPGRVLGVNGDRCDVAFDDGDRAAVHEANVRTPDVIVGSRVFAGVGFRPAEVKQQNGERLRVRYEDGQEEWLTLSRLRVQRKIVDVGEDPIPSPGMAPTPMGGPAPGMGMPMPVGGPMMPGQMMPGPMMGGPGPQVLEVGDPVDDLNWRVGDRVLARWVDLYWYPANLLAIGVKGYHVLYDDGDQRVVQEAQLMPLSFEEGEKIYAPRKGHPPKTYAVGTIARVAGEVVDIDFEDGERENNVRVSRARFWRSPVSMANFAFEEGERVLGSDPDGFAYPGDIVSIEDERIVVHYLDGLECALTPELIRRFQLTVGMPIQCRWKAGQQFFPGKLAALDGERVRIAYDDGDEEWTSVRLIRVPPAPPK